MIFRNIAANTRQLKYWSLPSVVGLHYVPPHRRLHQSITASPSKFFSSCAKSHLVDEKRAIAGTKKWIQDWVIDQNMCPFAAKSSYEVVAHCEDTLDVDCVYATLECAVLNFYKKARKDLEGQRYKNLFITFPNVFSSENSLEEFEELTNFLIAKDELFGLFGRDPFCSPYELLLSDSDAFFVVQTFHPENYATRIHKYSMRSPWPTLHLIFSDDLKAAWGPNDKVSRRIIEDNGRMLARFSDTELDEKLESYRNVEVEK